VFVERIYPPVLQSFYDIAHCVLFVPKGTKERYSASDYYWKYAQQIVEMTNGSIFYVKNSERVKLTYQITDVDNREVMLVRTEGDFNSLITGTVTIPEEVNSFTVTAIGDGVFSDCTNLTNVSIPKTVTNIGNLVFAGCTGLESIISYIEYPFEVPDNAFSSIANQAELTIPFDTETLYLSTNGWKQFRHITEVPPAETDFSEMDYVIYITDAKAIADNNQTMLVVKMKNIVTAAGFHFDLYLPDGCTFIFDDKGHPNATLSSERTDSNIKLTTSRLNSDGSMTVEAHSGNASVISGNDGAILMVPIIVAEGTEVGDNHIIKVKNWGMSDELGNTMPQAINPSVTYRLTVIPNIRGDVNNNYVAFIESSDFVALIRYLMELPHVELNPTATDANGDGYIDIGDLTAISNLKKYGSISRPVNTKTETKAALFTTPTEAE